MSPLDADELFACLDRHGVRYVLIGGAGGGPARIAAANRPKDHRSLPVLRQLLQELRRRGEA